MMQSSLVNPSPLFDEATPCLELDLSQALRQLASVRRAFAALHPLTCFAVKANSAAALLAALRDAGCGFDIASLAEMQHLQQLGVPAAMMIFSNPTKIPQHIAAAHRAGVDRFAFDSACEVEKLARYAPGSRVFLRVTVPHHGSRWPLDRKFGAAPDEAAPLLLHARSQGLIPYGLTFHVGSQNESPAAWLTAIGVCAAVWEAASDAGIALHAVDLGGGLPATYTTPVPSVAAIGQQVSRKLLDIFGAQIEYIIEPGRFLVAAAGTLTTSVIGKTIRDGRTWVYVDVSVFSGLLEVTGGWQYPIVTAKDDRPKRRVTLAGPTCDSTDIIAEDVLLPDLDVGDRLRLLMAGAYTTAYQAYNGIPFPHVKVIDGIAQQMEEAA